MSKGSFVPELGQAAFSNTPWTDIPLASFVEDGIAQLGAILEEYRLTDDNCAYNNGGEYSDEVFTIRAYCWCDGGRQGHAEGCPPNFESGDFKAFWYKHVGRSATMSVDITRAEWHDLYDRCVRAILAAPDKPR